MPTSMPVTEQRKALFSHDAPLDQRICKYFSRGLEKIIYDDPNDQVDGGANVIDVAGDVVNRLGKITAEAAVGETPAVDAVDTTRRLRFTVTAPVTLTVTEGTLVAGTATSVLTIDTTTSGAFTVRASYAVGTLANVRLEVECLSTLGPLPITCVLSEKNLDFA